MKTEEDTALAKTIHGGLEFIDTNHDCDRWFLQIECFDPHEPFYVPRTGKQSTKMIMRIREKTGRHIIM